MTEEENPIPDDEDFAEILRVLREADDVKTDIPGEVLFMVCTILQVGLRNTPSDSPSRFVALHSFNQMVAALEKRSPGCQRLFDLGWNPELDAVITFVPDWDDEF